MSFQQFSNECFCGQSDVPADYEVHGEGVCHMRCAGDDPVACGGYWAFSLYKFGDGAPAPTPEPEAAPAPTQEPEAPVAPTPEPEAPVAPTPERTAPTPEPVMPVRANPPGILRKFCVICQGDDP